MIQGYATLAGGKSLVVIAGRQASKASFRAFWPMPPKADFNFLPTAVKAVIFHFWATFNKRHEGISDAEAAGNIIRRRDLIKDVQIFYFLVPNHALFAI